MNPFMKISAMVMKSLVTPSPCKLYPFKKPVFFPNTRGSVAIDAPKCILCSLCAKKCPVDAIAVDRKERIWKIERHQCIACGACAEACPKKCLSMDAAYTTAALSKISDTVKIPEAPAAAAPAQNPAQTAAP
jgi:formate hydrogenlyase subunit 6/NADH:ubiquinone oxidoreductase subunit I